MKGKFIAAGGALATAVALCALAAPAEAAIERCDLGVRDRTHWLAIDPWGVYAGKRKAKACERHRFRYDFDAFDDVDDEADADVLDDDASASDEEELDEADARPHWSRWGHRGFGNRYGAARYGSWNGYNGPGPWYGR